MPMFTGIIQEKGSLIRKTSGPAGTIRLAIKTKKLRPKLGESISVNGVCLTVITSSRGVFEADVIPETLAKTNLGSLSKNAMLNLEPSLRMGDSISGHFVSGHVDGKVKVWKKGKIGTGLEIELPQNLRPFIAEKGSVTINGVSLTIAGISKSAFIVALTPFTQKQTNLGQLKKGDFVNCEIDLLARYLCASPS